MSDVLTVVAVATLALLYVPLALVTVNASVPTSPDSEKLLAVSVAAAVASYPLVGSLMIDAVTLLAVMCPGPFAVVGRLSLLAAVVPPAANSPAFRAVLTVVAVATLALLYVPLALVTVNESLPSSPDSEKLLAVSVAAAVPSYPLVGSLTIDAVTVFAVMCPGPLAVVGRL